MPASIRGLSVSLIVLGLATSLARANDPDQIKESLNRVTTALRNGDARTAKPYVIDEENNQKLVESLARYAKSLDAFYKAAVAQFGKEGEDNPCVGGARIELGQLPYMPQLAYLDEAQIAINGDTATIPPKRRGLGLSANFKKQGGMSKLVIDAGLKKASRHALINESMTNAYIELSGETKRGKYHTPNELQRAWLDKTSQAIQNSSPSH